MNESLPSVPPVPALSAEAVTLLRTPLSTIIAAVQNLRHYHSRMSAEKLAAVLDDIEHSAEDIGWQLNALLAAAAPPPGRKRKR